MVAKRDYKLGIRSYPYVKKLTFKTQRSRIPIVLAAIGKENKKLQSEATRGNRRLSF